MEVTVSVAALAGALYFASPCVWPLYPAYWSAVAGASWPSLSAARVMAHALAFLGGFGAVFAALGAAASGLGQWLSAYQPLLQRLAGVLIAALGLHAWGLLKLPSPPGPAARLGWPRGPGLVGAALAGAGFALGWTPCAVPVLGSILALASSTATLRDGVVLLLAFVGGFSVPFLVLTWLAWRLAGRAPRLGAWAAWWPRVTGATLVLLGVLVYTGGLARLSAWLFYLF